MELAGPLTFFAFFASPSHKKTALSAGLPREALSSMMGHRKQVVTFLTIESQAVVLFSAYVGYIISVVSKLNYIIIQYYNYNFLHSERLSMSKISKRHEDLSFRTRGASLL